MSVSVAGIYRFRRPERGYTPIAHQFSRHPTLKPRASRVGLYVLSHAEGFVQTQAAISRALNMDETTVRAALKDLESERFMVRHDVRDMRGHRTGTAYAVTDVPFTDEELEELRPGPTGKNPGGKSPAGKIPGPKKTTPVRETKQVQEDQKIPSGGSADAEPDNHQEPPMPRTADPVPQLGLFDAPPRQEPETQRPSGKNAGTVVAAYVDAHRRHRGGDPTKGEKGRVARDVGAMLREGKATMEELETAASLLGASQYANIVVEIKKLRDHRKPQDPTRGIMDAVPASAPVWAEQAAAEQAAREKRAAEDPEFAAIYAKYAPAVSTAATA